MTQRIFTAAFATAIAGLMLGCGGAKPLAQTSVCAEGVWDVAASGKTIDGQEYQGSATSTRYCLFDGALELDEYRALSPDGNTVFVGASFHYWSPDRQSVKTLWVMGGDPGYTLIDGAMKDGSLVSEGKGIDSSGAFLERSTQKQTDDRGYYFDMDRSYDNGETWIKSFAKSRATLRADNSPPLPEQLHPMIQQAKDQLSIGADSGRPILDGFAEIAEATNAMGADRTYTLKFSSRYMGPDRWRTVSWDLGANSIRAEELPIPSAENDSD